MKSVKELARKKEIGGTESGGARRREWTVGDFVAATGVDDEVVLGRLGALGFTPETVRLLHLVPLVQVAWSEGEVTRRERKLICDLAQLRGIRYDSPAFEQLTEWLIARPPRHFFRDTLDVLRAMFDAMPRRMRSEAIRSLVIQCSQVAAASRERAGAPESITDAEHRALEEIVAALATPGVAVARL